MLVWAKVLSILFKDGLSSVNFMNETSFL